MNITCFLDSTALNPQESSASLPLIASAICHRQFRLAHCTATGCAVTAVADSMEQLDGGIKPVFEQIATAQSISTRYDSHVMSDPITGTARLMVLAAETIPRDCFAAIGDLLANQGLTIRAIQRSLAVDEDPYEGIHAVALICSGTIQDPESAKTALQTIAQQHSIDLVLQDESTLNHDYRLVCFDMDSTLIKAEVIDELAKVHGVGEQVASITARTMRGELAFSGSFIERVALLNGLQAGVMQGIAESLPIMDGATRLCYRLGERGIKMAILSGGFTFFGQHLQALLGLDYVVANQLEIIDDVCTGKHLGEIVDASAKARHLLRLCEELEMNPQDAVAVGDGANDLEMIGTAGLGFAFHAKPLVRAQAPHTVNNLGLDALLHIL